MTDKPDNPLAFPWNQQQTQEGTWDQDGNEGMTLRDYFAGQADVVAYDPVETFFRAKGHYASVEELAAYIAQIRHYEADAMLAERSITHHKGYATDDEIHGAEDSE